MDPTLARWRTAARRRASTFCTIWMFPFALIWFSLKSFFGPLELKTADFFCETCGNDIHDIGEVCPRQLYGDCSACGGPVNLDRYGNCPSGRPTHIVSNRRAR